MVHPAIVGWWDDNVPVIDRRHALQSLGAVLVASAAGPACAARRKSATVSPAGSGVRRVPKLNLASDRIIRTVAGLRPFRPSGFVVKTIRLDDRIVVHNYGHGGGGVTLSWGTAHLAADEAIQTGERRAAVLGSGAVGLATARLLQRRGFEVNIYAKDLPPLTTSNIAGATWFPSSVVDADRRTSAFEEMFTRASRLSHRYFQDLVGDAYGVRWLDQYDLVGNEPVADSWEQTVLRGLFPEKRRLEADEHPFGVRLVDHYKTMLIEPPVYLNAVTRDFLMAGGRTVVREFSTAAELAALPERLVVNCTGLGSKRLFGDEELTPIKGQLSALLPQPEIDYILGAPDDIYMIPRPDGIMLGGSHQRGEWSLEPDPAISSRILDGHERLQRARKD